LYTNDRPAESRNGPTTGVKIAEIEIVSNFAGIEIVSKLPRAGTTHWTGSVVTTRKYEKVEQTRDRPAFNITYERHTYVRLCIAHTTGKPDF
jgi:hypothetical protein